MSQFGRRRARVLLLVLSALVVGLAPFPPAAGAADAPRWRVWELTRMSSGPTSIFPVISAAFLESRVVLAGAFLHRAGGRTTVLPGGTVFSDDGRALPSAYAAGRSVRCSQQECSTLPARGFNLLGMAYSDDGATPSNVNVVLLAAYGNDIKVDAQSKGWSLHEVRRSVAAVWTTDGADAAGVHSQKAGVEVFLSASLRGGPRGSIALGQLPCSSQLGLATSGVGTGQLVGGDTPVTSTCPRDEGDLGAAAATPVTWQLTGPVVGTTSTALLASPGPVRLLVISS